MEEFSLLVTIAVLVGILTLLWLVLPSQANRRFWKIPGPEGIPIFGNALQLPLDPSEFYRQLQKYCNDYDYTPVFKIMLGRRRMAVLAKAESVEVILSSTKHITKSPDYDPLLPWLGTGLLTSTGEKWRTRRRMLTPSFHFRILQDFLQVFNEQSKTLVDKLGEHVGKGEFDIFPRITLCALDIICDTAMGRTVNAQEDTDSSYVEAIYKMSELVHLRQKQPWLWPDWIYSRLPAGKTSAKCLKILHDFTRKVIRERMVEYEQNAALNKKSEKSESPKDDDIYMGRKKRLAFLDMLLHTMYEEKNLTFSDIQEEVDTFMFEGHDTTAAAANWAVHLIGANPEVQQKLHDEIDRVFGGDDRDITADDLKELKYLDCVIKETLRIFPSVPMIGRLIEEDVEICGHEIPAGSVTILMLIHVLRDQRFFPEPEKFDPDRFILENSAGRHPYSFVPFSAGQRNCIGQKFAMMEEKVILASILRHYQIEATQSREELDPLGELILRPRNGILIKLTRRNPHPE